MTYDDYYKNIDLISLAQDFDNTDPDRAKNIAFTHAVETFAGKSEIEKLDVSLLLKICGQPDEIIHCEDFDVWKYSWYGRHGPSLYLSFTPFKIQSNTVRCLERDEWDNLNRQE